MLNSNSVLLANVQLFPFITQCPVWECILQKYWLDLIVEKSLSLNIKILALFDQKTEMNPIYFPLHFSFLDQYKEKNKNYLAIYPAKTYFQGKNFWRVLVIEWEKLYLCGF